MRELFTADAGPALINITLLAILFIVALAIARLRSLFAIVMLSGVYSLISATWYIAVDAVDVGYTEAAVGAGMSTAVLLGAMLLTARTAKPDKPFKRIGPFLICGATAVMLIYATVDLPGLGDPSSPANTGPGMTYVHINWYDTAVPNVVTSVLASYRSFDTMGETVVVFVAGLAVAMLLGFGERSLAETLRKTKKRRGKGKEGDVS
ncbi:MAG: cation:proton antiporter [Alphaproteobacteria bacterium HGW-Alphaproteobacteria-18]|nr:MAG: cation:proton antiporter [Alphaproteobacteria bacterium HGW-Alphaproteobacteria-18]